VKFPKHIFCELKHNDFALDYSTAKMRVSILEDLGAAWFSEEQKQRAIDTNEVWELIWNPSTPIGSYHYAAPTLAELLNGACAIE